MPARTSTRPASSGRRRSRPPSSRAHPSPRAPAADTELAGIHGVALEAGAANARTGTAPAVDASADGTVSGSGRCVRFRPDAARAVGAVPELQLTLPSGGVRLRTGNGPATVSVRRFAGGFPEAHSAAWPRPRAPASASRPTARGRPGTCVWRPRRSHRMWSRLTPRGVVTAVAAACCSAGRPCSRSSPAATSPQPRLLAGDRRRGRSSSRSPWPDPAPLPRSRPGRLALGGLAAITIWSARLARLGAAAAAPPSTSVQRLVLYTGALIARDRRAARTRAAQRAVEPALAAGATVVIGYGLAGRLLPDLVDARPLDERRRAARAADHVLERRGRAGCGRARPVRAHGRRPRAAPRGLRAAGRGGHRRRSAPASTSPTRAARSPSRCSGSSCSSRCAPTRAAAARGRRRARRRASPPRASRPRCRASPSLEGDAPRRATARSASALLARARRVAARADRAPRAPRRRRRSPWRAPARPAIAVALRGGRRRRARGRRPRASSPSAGRARRRRERRRGSRRSSSNRYEYWRVGARARSRDAPAARGSAPAASASNGCKERTIAEAVRDTHSLEVEMAAELGLRRPARARARWSAASSLARARRAAPRPRRPPPAGPRRCSPGSCTRRSTGTGSCPAVTLPAIVARRRADRRWRGSAARARRADRAGARAAQRPPRRRRVAIAR